MNTVVLLAGGMGSRMGQDIPKQFIHVNNIRGIISLCGSPPAL